MWKIPSWEERKVSPAICEVYELFIQPLILLFYRVVNLINIFSAVFSDTNAFMYVFHLQAFNKTKLAYFVLIQ